MSTGTLWCLCVIAVYAVYAPLLFGALRFFGSSDKAAIASVIILGMLAGWRIYNGPPKD